MIWRNPAAWLGLATLLIPVVIHLLNRQQAESRPFPSLRFILPSRLSAVRRRVLTDWPLLAVRLLILAAVVAALADPLWETAARRAAWAARTATAIVIDTTPSANPDGPASANANAAAGASRGLTPDRRAQQMARTAAEGSFHTATFETTALAEGIGRAVEWLRTAPPARRELAIVSDFQIGAFDAAMLRDVPGHVGVNFFRPGPAPVTRTATGQPVTGRAQAARGKGATAAEASEFDIGTPHVTVTARETAVEWRRGPASVSLSESAGTGTLTLHPFRLTLRAGEADRPFIRAAAEAVLAQGVPIGARTAAAAEDVTIVITDTNTNEGASLPKDVTPLAAPWMAAVLDHVASDDTLAQAVAHAVVRDSAAPPAPWMTVLRDEHGRPALLAAARAAAPGSSAPALVLVSRVPASDETTALLIRATLRGLSGPDPLPESEVLAVPGETLARLQRPATDPPPSAWQHVDSDDRRWLWGAALALLALEHLLRRRRRQIESHSDGAYEHAA